MPTPLSFLLVEDNPFDAELVLRELQRAGFEPTWQRVDEATAYLEQLHPDLDLVISDYAMPQFNGLRALELLKQRGWDIPFILVSGTIGEETAVEAMQLGAADYLLKDRLARLGQAVSRALEARRWRAEDRRKIAQLELQGAALAATANAIVITDREGTIQWVNPAFTRMTGYTLAEAVGKNPRNLVHSGENEHKVYQGLWETILAGRVWHGELVNRRKDGSVYPEEQTITPVRDAAGEITHFIAVKQDLTDRKQAEAALQREQALLSSLISTIPDHIYFKDRQARFVRINDSMARRFGLSDAAEAIGKSDRDFFTEEHARPAIRDDLRVVETGSPIINVEEKETWGNGEFSWVSTTKVPLRNPEGEITGLVGISRDITEHKKAEAALRESGERFRQLAENINEVFWMTDPVKNSMLYISPAYATIWGRTCESLYAAPQNWGEAIHPEDRLRVLDAISAKQSRGAYDEIYRIERPDGTVRWIHDKAFPVKDAVGKVYRIVGVAEDITDRKNLEEQFMHAQRQEAIGTMATGLAHDLNNILTPVLIATGLLKDKLDAEHDLAVVGMIETSILRGANIIRQLLAFSRGADSTRASLPSRPLLTDVASIMEETFPRNITIRSDLAGDLWNVVADPTQLHQVLLNLCVNARDAMPEGGKLTLSAKNTLLTEEDVRGHDGAKAGPHVMVTLTDSGHGIPPEILPRIFEPFFTTKGPGKGTGLGLASVAGIVKSHHGFVTVYSQPGWGTVFKVHLPALVGSNAAETSVVSLPLWRGNNETILVVDDEEPIRESLRLILEKHNYRVLLAGSAEEALKLFVKQGNTVRLVLTDLMMAGMDGMAFIRALRVMDAGIRVVACSGLNREGLEAELGRLGVREFLPKPFDPTTLLDALGRALVESR